MASPRKKPPIIMVSSTVYGIEDLLDQIYAALTSFGYEVWCSHSGTVQAFSNVHAFDSCLKAVEDCDLFLGLITPQYGSGVMKGELSITHQELIKAVELNKPRWFLAHDHVVFARRLLTQLGHKSSEDRAKLTLKEDSPIDDLRVIDMYEAATRHEIRFEKPSGNWVQKFVSDEDALRYATAQFHRFQEVERFLEEQLKDREGVLKRIEDDQAQAKAKGGPS